MTYRGRGFGLFAVVVSVGLLGCGGGPKGPKTAQVSGTVTLDGAPLDEGSINFIPEDGTGAPAGTKIVKGSYSVAVPLGSKRVEIRAPKVVGQKVAYEGDPNSPKIDLIEERVPHRYNATTELKTVVTDGTNKADFPLVTPQE